MAEECNPNLLWLASALRGAGLGDEDDGFECAVRAQLARSVRARKDCYLGGSPAGATISRHFPSGAIDGVNTVFALSPPPTDPNAFFLVWNGLVMDPSNYTLAGGVLTTTDFTPRPGDTFFALY